MFGLAGYDPVAVESVAEALQVHGARLRGLVGRKLESVTGLCFTVDDPELAVAWADPLQSVLSDRCGAVVAQVNVFEHEFRLDRVDGVVVESWALAGLELIFTDERPLQLYNVFSELTIAAKPTGFEGWRQQPVP